MGELAGHASGFVVRQLSETARRGAAERPLSCCPAAMFGAPASVRFTLRQAQGERSGTGNHKGCPYALAPCPSTGSGRTGNLLRPRKERAQVPHVRHVLDVEDAVDELLPSRPCQ